MLLFIFIACFCGLSLYWIIPHKYQWILNWHVVVIVFLIRLLRYNGALDQAETLPVNILRVIYLLQYTPRSLTLMNLW